VGYRFIGRPGILSLSGGYKALYIDLWEVFSTLIFHWTWTWTSVDFLFPLLDIFKECREDGFKRKDMREWSSLCYASHRFRSPRYTLYTNICVKEFIRIFIFSILHF